MAEKFSGGMIYLVEACVTSHVGWKEVTQKTLVHLCYDAGTLGSGLHHKPA